MNIYISNQLNIFSRKKNRLQIIVMIKRVALIPMSIIVVATKQYIRCYISYVIL